MFIDCGTCVIRGAGCADCVVTVLLGAEDDLEHAEGPIGPRGVEVGSQERSAIAVLAQVGLVPHLRHTPAARHVS